nr:MAG TPA: hypothetical protein [Caudoviricetes sp.]
MSNMTLDEAIEHCKKVAKEQENCNEGCSLEHRQLAIWLSDLKAITENSYEDFKRVINIYTHDYTLMALQGRLDANPSISSKEVAKLVADDVKYLLEELALNNRYFVPKKV